MNLNLEDKDFFQDIHDPKNWDVKCDVCKKPYKSKNTICLWEEEYGTICHDCYLKNVNENPSEKQIRKWAEYSLSNPLPYSELPMKPFDCSYENFEKLVQPMMKKIREEQAAEAERKHKQELHERAKKLYDECLSDPVNVIARLLDEIEKVKDSIPERDISQVRFR